MHWIADLQLLGLILVAHAAPVLLARLYRRTRRWPVDGGHRLAGERLFGASKTWPGLMASVLATSGIAWLGGIGAGIGLLVGGTAMAGDLLSSFIKRRLGLPPGSRASGLDQLPESLLPAWAAGLCMPLAAEDIFLTGLAFMITEIWISPLLFRAGIRKHPY